jgi:uncharacterized protein YxeA
MIYIIVRKNSARIGQSHKQIYTGGSIMKAIVLGVLFVILCVGIPSLLGYYHSDNKQLADTFEQEVEQESSIEPETNEGTPPYSTEGDETDYSLEQINEEKEELVFSTTEEAMEAVLEHFSLTELISIYQSVRNGADEKKREEIITMLQERFSDEEIEALKVIGFSELDKVLQ